MIAEAHVRGDLNRLNKRDVRFVLVGSALLFALGDGILPGNQFIAFHVWAVAFCGVLIAVLIRRTEFAGPFARLFKWLGGFSYSIYIVHVPLLVLAGVAILGGTKQDNVLWFYLSIPCVVAVAYGFYWIFERPAVALSQKVKKTKRNGIALPIPVIIEN